MQTMHSATWPYFLLTKQTFIAMTNGTLVFLDLRRDNYSCVERRHASPVACLLGLPVATIDEGQSQIVGDEGRGEINKVIKELIDQGLITSDPNEGKRAEFVMQYGELKEMLGYLPGEGPVVRFGDIIKFFKALIVTSSLLKVVPIQRIVARVKGRKERVIQRRTTPNDERRKELLEIYKILRPIFVTVKDQCLFNSLFLIEFLACYRIYPDWYFGVQLNEFYAHCWVQERNIIYDDSIQNTSGSQPIMIV